MLPSIASHKVSVFATCYVTLVETHDYVNITVSRPSLARDLTYTGSNKDAALINLVQVQAACAGVQQLNVERRPSSMNN